MNSSVANESIEIFLRIVVTGDSRMKKVGGALRGQGKSRGSYMDVYLAGDFSLFWRLSCYDLPYQTQHRLVNIIKNELALIFTRDT